MLKQTKLLVIGGPKEFEWLPDVEYSYIVVPMPMGLVEFSIDPPLTEAKLETVKYRKLKLGDPRTYKIKQVYVVEGMSDEEAIEELKDYLITQFINMEDVTD